MTDWTPEMKDAAWDSVSEEVGRQPGLVAAFFAGSLVEGFGNPTSDADLLVLVEDMDALDLDADAPGDAPRQFSYGDIRIAVRPGAGVAVDVEYRSLGRLRDLIDGLRTVDTVQGSPYVLDGAHFQFLHQLRVGDAVEPYGDAVEKLRAEVPWPVVAVQLFRMAEGYYTQYAEDAIGAIRGNDWGAALLTSYDALGSAVDAFTAAHGHTNTKPKWRFRKLEALGRPDVVEKYRSACGREITDTASAIDLAKARLRLAQQLLADGFAMVNAG